MAEVFDYVIVGGGTAGCVLANRLSADPAVSVLLLESGGPDDYFWIHVPVGYLYCIGNPRTDWCYSTEPEPGLAGRALGYPRGRVLGGCSSINGMIYMRGQPEDYDRWRELGASGWAWSDVLPYFLKSEDFHAGASAQHGVGGEWRVEEQRLSWKILDEFRAAAAAAGIPARDEYHGGSDVGTSYFRVNQRRGRRLNTAQAFLDPVRRRPNLTVRTGVTVARVSLDGVRASGVEAIHEGARRAIGARREVLLAAGAIGSPQLLELSGIGDGARLQELGIRTVRHLPGVGENLQDHLQLRCAFRVEGVPTLNERARSWVGKAGIALEYLLLRSGPMSMAPSQLGVFAKSAPGVSRPDIEFHVQPLSLERFGEPLHDYPAFTAAPCHLRPESRGSVHIGSTDPAQPPRIRPNYLSTEGDRQVARAAIRLARQIVHQAPLAPYRPSEIRPGPQFETDAQLDAAAAAIGTTIFHPVGTARIGHDPLAVVDAQLRVHGIEALRVVDASVMPTITSGNTCSPTIMIAERAADLIRGLSPPLHEVPR